MKNEILTQPRSYRHLGTEYRFIATNDNTPSLIIGALHQPTEAMHNSAGALSESLFIYGELLQETLRRGWKPQILSIGLGCGYNEWITLAMTEKILPNDFYLESFEANPLLRESFIEWLSRNPSESAVSMESELTVKSEILFLFKTVLHLVAAHFQQSPLALFEKGRKLFTDKQWIFREQLSADTIFNKKFNTVYFDAFSGKTTPELWNEAFLDTFLEAATDTHCGLASYAATGQLRRSLKKAGFNAESRPGFAGKRESTYAFRSTNPTLL